MSETLSQKAYSHIHDRLVTGALKPGGRLSNRGLAKEVGISFTPVREALNRLVSEGLLEYREGVGVFVPVPSRKEIEEIYEVREMLECAVVRRVSGRITPNVLSELRDHNLRMQTILEKIKNQGASPELLEGFRTTDVAFHVALFRGTGNRLLLEMATGIRKICTIKTAGSRATTGLVGPTLHRFNDAGGEAIRQLERTQANHACIIDSLEKGDVETAAAAMSEHLREGCRLALEAFDHANMNRART